MRTGARELAFKLIFERLFVKESYTFDEEFFASLTKEDDKNFAKELVIRFEENRQEIEETVSSKLVGYSLDRVYKVDLALIYLAVTEIKYIQTPHQVVINEVVELSKQFSTEKSSRFINGVLSAIIKG
ncbi:MAG: transcription antitermination factor NusB [Clostridia bacterium]|nr:transcription antitermination factor NusB [Clostridia bacterium]MBQ8793035.1 transcription antitermination factor NusB [Clostridia bacterium]